MSMMIFAMLLHWGAVVLTCIYILRKSVGTNGTLYCIIFAVSSILLSVKYWENFTGVANKATNLPYLKLINQTRRTKMVLISYLWKTIICFICVIGIHGIKAEKFAHGVRAIFNFESTKLQHKFSSLNLGSDDSCSTYVPYIIAIINICSSYTCAKAAKTACVVGCQRLCFSLPLMIVILAAPFAMAGLMYDPTILKFTDCDLLFSNLNLTILGEMSDIWPIVASGIMLFISVLCTTWYIWTTNGYKLGELQRYDCIHDIEQFCAKIIEIRYK